MERSEPYPEGRDRPASWLMHHWRQRVALAALTGLCLLPFLVPFRTLPTPSFYAEWLALLTGLLALPVLAGRSGLVVPRIVLLPAGFAVLLLVQSLWLSAALRPALLIALLYLIWAGLLMLATTALLREVSLSRLVAWLTLALAVAALVNACSVILFQAGLRAGSSGWFLRTDRAGNLGQANMLADLLWLGVASVLYRWQFSRRGWLYAAWLAPLLVASALTGSRAPLLYALWLVLVAACFNGRRLTSAAAWIAVFYIAAVAAVHWLPIQIMGGSDSLTRMLPGYSLTEAAAGNIRVDLMRMASLIFLDHPWTGAGWGSFPWESYVRAGDLVSAQAVAEHAHQFFFQLMAELGAVAPVLAAVTLLLWAWPVWHTRMLLREHPAYGWAVGAAGILLLHSQLEYPLWYAHLLGIFAIVLACAEQRSFSVAIGRHMGLVVVAVMATGAYLLASSMSDYTRLEQWIARDMRRGVAPAPEGHYQLLAELSQNSLLQMQAVRALAAVMPPTTEQLVGKREVCRRALQSEPQAPAVFTCALLDDLAGEKALAEQRMRQAQRVFSSEFPAYRQRLKTLLPPAQWAEQRPLLEMRPTVVQP